MRTVTIDIINEKVLSLLKELELLKLIRVRQENMTEEISPNNWLKLKGAMSKQPLNDIDQQLNDLRNEWE